VLAVDYERNLGSWSQEALVQAGNGSAALRGGDQYYSEHVRSVHESGAGKVAKGAKALLAEALENNPPPDLEARIKLRLAATFLAKKDAKAALAQALAVAKTAPPHRAAEARYLAGEARIQQQDWAGAIEQLLPFRDQEARFGVRDVSDRALLRLGQAFAQAGQWAPSSQAFGALLHRYPQSPWAEEARYGMGWAYQGLKQYEEAVQTYTEVTRRTAAEVAARAQLQIGLCRLEQKRYPEAANALMAVSFTYDYPDWRAAAWCEAAKAYVAMNRPADATKALQQVLRDQPKSKWADVARQRLSEIK
jgi:TolA-binding protein